MTGSPIRIAAHCGGGTFGGTETWTARFLAGLQERGHSVHIFARDSAMVARFAEFGVPVSVGKVGGVVMLPDAVRLARRLRRFSPDVFLCLTTRKMWLAGLAGRWARVPRTLFRVANQGAHPNHALTRFAFHRFVDQVLCNADELRRPFLDNTPGFDPERVITVYDGVAARDPTPGVAVRNELGLESVPVIGAVGRLAGQKRFDRLIEAVSLLPDVHCVIAGDGPARAALEEQIGRLGLAGRVHLLGFRPDVPDVLAALDVFVLTSDFEGMSNAMLEAMSMGVPVVSTPVSGAAEALLPVAGDPAGVVVPAGQEAIARACRRLLADEPRRAALGRTARARYERAFTFEGMMDVWERVLRGESLGPLHQGPSPLVS